MARSAFPAFPALPTPHRPYHIAVIGAGMAGTACARTLVQAGFRVTVFEKEAQAGGRMAHVDTRNGTFDAGVMPYYLHVLDKVQGAAHFMVSDDEARQIMRELLTLVSGYLVPKLAREIGGEPSKTPLDLQLRQQ